MTRQVLVKDDIAAVTDFTAMTGRRTAGLGNATANGDRTALATGDAPVFVTSASRTNKAATGPVVASRRLVGPNLELPARQLAVVGDADQVNRESIFTGMIDPVVEPLIPANHWHISPIPKLRLSTSTATSTAPPNRALPPGQSRASAPSTGVAGGSTRATEAHGWLHGCGSLAVANGSRTVTPHQSRLFVAPSVTPAGVPAHADRRPRP
jgi:hypothetical protein